MVVIRRIRQRLALLAGLFVLVTIGVVVLTNLKGQHRVLRADPKKEVAIVKRIARTEGVLEAHAYVQKNFFTYAEDVRHYLGHFVGEQIYEAYGLDGISHCYSSVEFGCIHGFILTGYLAEGTPFLEGVIARCNTDEPVGCTHGLGHALLLTRGYEHEDLEESLEDCVSYDLGENSRDDCLQGVFMEYNVRFTVNADLSASWFEPRVFDARSPLSPCDWQPEELQPICYRELLLYWSNVPGMTNDTMVAYCDLIPDTAGKRECYWSYGGYIAGTNNNDLMSSLAVCSAFADPWKRSCIKGVVNSVAFENQVAIVSLCDRLSSPEKEACQTW